MQMIERKEIYLIDRLITFEILKEDKPYILDICMPMRKNNYNSFKIGLIILTIYHILLIPIGLSQV